ncbi:glycosyltransferase family 4 protein [Burkholderia ubonensis]|uniref:Glycosyltransferase family 1 protein n=1 Tax=Burkholderia ubonensis TaxID=101571 RepID=A0AB74D7U5_9BURK|nr:glycosyltransferase family 1 protein [Burkholderia ubonensis]PAJ77032.1 glycosyl transferase [Burkholderia ubonensis]PAJ88681.1 glycosyl transferase [Burkholderia ubonensis]PAJ89621.1 glycosyl transferase [Burkholderia ubonensis]PAJ99112.1 glycosyl transferase [Burkholderia ubonensis]PAK09215.1 glycosyl transferase [Burkholderia ubonensis]
MSTFKKPKELVYNGRFTTQKTTGVQRVARELIAALVTVHPQDSITILVPPNTDAVVSGARTIKVGFSKGVIWEQLVLPLFAHRNRIVNLSNSGSIFLGSQIIYLHDAAVFDTPAHFSRLFRAWYRIMFRILARTSICVLTNSRFSRERLAHHCGVSTEKISVVPLGADHLDALEPDMSILEELALTSGRFVLAVSSMNPTKNFGRLIAAFRKINDPSVDLVIVGMRNAAVFGTQDEISATEPNIKYAGYVSDEKLKALYQNAACFLYPSIYEGFGIPPLEAMRYGCPTLVGNAAALPEVCADAALYCDPYSTNDIAEKLRNLLESADLRADLKRRGLLHAEQYRWSKSAEMMTRIFNTL